MILQNFIEEDPIIHKAKGRENDQETVGGDMEEKVWSQGTTWTEVKRTAPRRVKWKSVTDGLYFSWGRGA